MGSSSRPFALVSLVTLSAVAAASSSPSFAQTPKPASKASTLASASASASVAPAPAPGPDVIRFKEGGFVRGTLVEYDPKGKLVVQVDGVARTYESASVAYAGPAASDPGVGVVVSTVAPSADAVGAPPAPPPEPAPAASPVHLRANLPDIQFHYFVRSDTAEVSGVASGNGGSQGFSATVTGQSFQPICIAPCEAKLDTGLYRIGLSRGDAPAVLVPGNVSVTQGGTLQGTYISKSGVRAGGIVLIVGGSLALLGGALALGGSDSNEGAGLVLTALGAGGLVGGLLLRRTKDQAKAQMAKQDVQPSLAGLGPNGGFATVRTTALGANF
jgi:hypothetical protein